MDRVEGKSADVLDEKLAQLGKIFPEFLTEARGADGKLRRAFDFDALKNLLSDRPPETNDMYQFSWVGKTTARAEAYRRLDKTLRPCLDRSVDWDKTRNLYIEGDNLEVLKLLQRGYMNKVKMIYIDPPYNTGRDFIYRDRFKLDESEYAAEVGLFDDESGDKNFVENSESNPRFHSDWCSMIYARLLLARNLLTDDGVIFISIDDGEQANLKKICDEIFGESNFIAALNWRGRSGGQDSKYYAIIHEYIFCYAKFLDQFTAGTEIVDDAVYPKYDEKVGRYYKTQLLRKWGSNSRRADRPNLFYPITAPDGSAVYPMLSSTEEGRWRWSRDRMAEAIKEGRVEFVREGCWRWGKDKMETAIAEGRVEFLKKGGEWIAYEKIFAPLAGEERTKKYVSWIDDVSNGTDDIKNLFGTIVFNYSKSVALIKKFLLMARVDSDSLVMDFFSGSATTAHAVMQLNAEDNGNRRFIMVQIADPCPANSEAYKAGYNTICDIGRERIIRAGQKIKEAAPLATTNLDVGFRCLKVDEINFKNVSLTVDALIDKFNRNELDDLEENIKPDRSALDLLYGCLLDWNVELSLPYTSEKYGGATLHNYGDGALIACFDSGLDESVIEYIAKKKPLRAVFRDSSFQNDAARLNAEEIMKLHSPGTDVKVI